MVLVVCPALLREDKCLVFYSRSPAAWLTRDGRRDRDLLSETEKRVLAHPAFRRLVRKRRRLTWGLATLFVGLYILFSLAAVWYPESLGRAVAEGSAVNFAILLAYGIIGLGIVLSGFYVHRANTELARLQRELEQDLQP